MVRNKIYAFLILFVLVQCSKKPPPKNNNFQEANITNTKSMLEPVSTSFDTNCHITGPVVSQLIDKEGTVTYRKGIPLYSITYGIENSFDSKWIGYVCNMPDKFKQIGLKVRFSGKYYHAYKYIEQETAGETNLYLQLDSIKVQ